MHEAPERTAAWRRERRVLLRVSRAAWQLEQAERERSLGKLRSAGWPAPEDPDGDDDAELDGRDSIADRLSDEVSWLRQCAD